MKRNILFQIFSLQILTSSFAERIKVNSEFFLSFGLRFGENARNELFCDNRAWVVNYIDCSNNVSLPCLFNFSYINNERYQYHCWIPLQLSLLYLRSVGFFLLSCDISLLHTRHYICLKRVHTIELLLSGRILISNGYL